MAHVALGRVPATQWSNVKKPPTESMYERWLYDLWRRHSGQVRAYLMRRTTMDSVDDLLSEVFVVAWRHRERPPRKPLPWLYGIAAKVLSTHYRGTTRRRNLVTRLESQPSNSQFSVDLALDIETALEKLSPTDRDLLLLNAWEGMSPAEIAVSTGSNPAAVRMRLSRARRKFEKSIDDAQTNSTEKDEGQS